MSRVFRELQRRKVFKVGVAYLAVAWLLIQLVNEIGPILGAPDWFPRLVLGLLAGGFVISLVLAWVYEFTSSGIHSTRNVDRDEQLVPTSGRALNFIIIGALTLALGYFIWESRFSVPVEDNGSISSIAILPFTDMSAAKDQEYFADGMAEELLTMLSRLPGLRVAGRTSSFSFKGSDVGLDAIAEALNVSHVLEGSVRKSGNRLRVTAKLVDVEEGFQVWSRTFDRELLDVFAVQDEIAAGVLEGLRAHIAGQSGNLQRGSSTVLPDFAAYDEYLLGRFQLARRTPEAIVAAIEHFRRATQGAPDYSPAWSALAKSLAVSPWYGLNLAAPDDLAMQARAAAQRALELDPENSEAHSVTGTVILVFDQDWEAAESWLRRAVELHPNEAGNANLLGDYLYIIGDFEGALEFERRAAQLEPLSAAFQHELALVLSLLGRTEEAIAQERRAVQLNPEFLNGWSSLVRLLTESGALGEAREMLAKAPAGMEPARRELLLARIAMAEGNIADAGDYARRALSLAHEQGRSLLPVSHMLALLGEDQAAAKYLQEALASGDPVVSSPLYFFLPEDWEILPTVKSVLDASALGPLFALRREHMAARREVSPGVVESE